MDVVPPGDAGWQSDPFSLTVRQDAYVGRGVCDMKGFLALAINRFAERDLTRLRHPLVLVLTYDEEVGTLGARHLAETWSAARPLPKAAIIGEPTSLGVVRMHKGHLRLRLEFTGVPAHSGMPHLGRNAIEPAGAAIVALTELRLELESERSSYSRYFPEVPFVTLNVARVWGGEAINVVPAHCAIELGIRLLPEMSATAMIDRVREIVQSAVGEVPFALELIGESPAMVVAEDAPIHHLLCRQLGQDGTLSAPYATDAGWLQRLGLDCVLCGPGSISVAHKPNEFMRVADFAQGGELLKTVVHQFCESGAQP
jgi:acetylornithine deacetylase